MDELEQPPELELHTLRAHDLERLGFSIPRARELATTNIDLFELARLIGLSCPLELAVEIAR